MGGRRAFSQHYVQNRLESCFVVQLLQLRGILCSRSELRLGWWGAYGERSHKDASEDAQSAFITMNQGSRLVWF